MTPSRVNVLGTGISVLNLGLAKTILAEASANPSHTGYVTITGVHGVMESREDAALQAIHNESFLSTPDGMPMVWLGRMYGHPEMDRVYGPELMEDVVAETEGQGIKHFFYGGNDGVAQNLKARLQELYPQAEVCGVYTPPFRPLSAEEEADLVTTLQKEQPHYLWVGLSTPKQERFMHDFLKRYPNINEGWGHGFTMFGVGAAFDFLSGGVGQAPFWVQRSGFEWLYRVFKEPKRLWKRYSYNNSKFIFSILGQLLKNSMN